MSELIKAPPTNVVHNGVHQIVANIGGIVGHGCSNEAPCPDNEPHDGPHPFFADGLIPKCCPGLPVEPSMIAPPSVLAAAREQAIVDEWNSRHPVGTRVRYWTMTREFPPGEGRTCSEASVLGGHTAVVWIDNAVGAIALTHVDPLPPNVVKVELGDPRYCQRGERHDPHPYTYELPGGVTGRYECDGQPWPGAAVGYIVAGYEGGKLVENWDGEVHPTLHAGRASLGQCRESGYPDWKLYALTEVPDA